MRLLIVGTLKGQLTTATKIAMDNGASVTHAEAAEQAMNVLRGGKGADLLLVELNERREAKGLPPVGKTKEEHQAEIEEARAKAAAGQRQQPMSKKRQKAKGIKDQGPLETGQDDVQQPEKAQGPVINGESTTGSSSPVSKGSSGGKKSGKGKSGS